MEDASESGLSFEEIQRLVNLAQSTGVAEITLRSGSSRVTVRVGPPSAIPAAAPPVLTNAAAPTMPAQAVSADGSPDSSVEWIEATMVGIYHPAKPPLDVGSAVERGQIVGLIESMKLMNDVRAEFGGSVTEIAVEPGMAVEYGHRLFAVAVD